MDFLYKPWPWYVAGPLIGLTVPLLLLLGNKRLGISSTLRQICAACIPAHLPLLTYDWRRDSWNLVFALGLVIGGDVGGVRSRSPIPVADCAATPSSFSTQAPSNSLD